MHQRRDGGWTYLLTVTAPGDPHIDKTGRSGCAKGDWCTCSPAPVDLAEWNAGHSKRWNHLRTELSRRIDGIAYLRAVEVQDGHRGGSARGALHDHVILWSPVRLHEDAAVPGMGDLTLRQLVIRCGFGHSVDVAECEPGSKRAAYYVAKYITKACDSRGEVPWLKWDGDTGEVLSDRATYRTWSSSRNWGLTMREIREFRRAAAERYVTRQHEETLALLGATLGAEPVSGADPPL